MQPMRLLDVLSLVAVFGLSTASSYACRPTRHHLRNQRHSGYVPRQWKSPSRGKCQRTDDPAGRQQNRGRWELLGQRASPRL